MSRSFPLFGVAVCAIVAFFTMRRALARSKDRRSTIQHAFKASAAIVAFLCASGAFVFPDDYYNDRRAEAAFYSRPVVYRLADAAILGSQIYASIAAGIALAILFSRSPRARESAPRDH